MDEKDIAALSASEIIVLLNKTNIGTLNPSSIESLGSALVLQAVLGDSVPERFAASTFPSAAEILAMLARDRDVDDYLESASEEGSSGDYYEHVAALAPVMKPLRGSYEALFAGVRGGLAKLARIKSPEQASGDAVNYRSGVTLPGLSSRPREGDYDFSHTYALDIFLKDVKTLPFSTLEKGPTIFSIADGIVVATNSSWKGGEDLASYKSGGITPKAGNGVIVYSPRARKYYLYFHLYDVLVSPGDAIPKGHPLGHSGNTGANARKPGHGEHVHLEIYDAASGRFLRNREIADIVF